MREIFSEKIVHFAKKNKKFLVLTGDHGYALFDKFLKTSKSQYINAGVAEQNMVGMAAGLAKEGFQPLVYGLSAFIPIRTLEQIKIDIAHDNLKVILIGDGAGVVYSHLGTSHQCLEDISCLRSIPNVSILSPGDSFEMSACMDYAINNNGPTYIRIGKSDLGDFHTKRISNKKISEPIFIKKSSDKLGLTFIATGSMVNTALDLSTNYYKNANVVSIPMIVPLKTKKIIDIFKSSKNVVIMEEHSIHGGLSSTLLVVTSEYLNMPRVLKIGSNKRFSKKCGTYHYLIKEHGLDKLSVKKKIDKFLS